jgi:16S rRNA (cytosine967-C5)-methyltransferase
MRFYNYLNVARQILDAYKGEVPFHVFIKNFFSDYKKAGSRDRKLISEICYSWFRLGNSLNSLDWDARVRIALRLCSDASQWNSLLPGDYAQEVLEANLVGKRLELLRTRGIDVDLENVFPSIGSVTLTDREKKDFASSHFLKPDVFVRIRPGFNGLVEERLRNNNIGYELAGELGARLKSGVQLDKLFDLDREIVVQDLSSQNTGRFIVDAAKMVRGDSAAIKLWDCCAASGGKSILAYDLVSPIKLTVSDIRKSILENLMRRFRTAGIDTFNAHVADIREGNDSLPADIASTVFDMIIADVPCSGSGTWGRSPEHLRYFNVSQIEYYSSLQKKILENVRPRLRSGGALVYITCSVYKQENQDVLDYAASALGLQLSRAELITGYQHRADSLFAAILIAG